MHATDPDAMPNRGHDATRDLVVFDDGRGALEPLTQLRPAFALRTGVWSNRQRLERALGSARAVWVPDGLAAVQREVSGSATVNALPDEGHGERDVLAISGRWLGDDAALLARVSLLKSGEGLRLNDGTVLAACGSRPAMLTGLEGRWSDTTGVDWTQVEARVLSRPWHVLDFLEATLGADLLGLARCEGDGALAWSIASALPMGVTRVGEAPVLMGAGATLHPHVHVDTTLGPVAFGAGCVVHPFSVIEGPAYVGPGAVVAAQTSLRSGCVIGRCCKVGGEVKASVIDDFSNKAHHGYLGNAVVGRWCNLGAGTTASNLKNTWGPVRMQTTPSGLPEDTGRTFQGPVLGDFVRTAIGTLLPTGAVVGAGSCLVTSGFAPKFVPAMTFLTDGGAERNEPAKLFATLARMMERRGQTPGEALKARLAALLFGDAFGVDGG